MEAYINMKTVKNRTEFLNEIHYYLPKEITAIELGVFDGTFSKEILEILTPKTLFLVDPFHPNEETYGDAMQITTAYSTKNELDLVLIKFKKEIEKGQVFVVKEYSYNAVKCHDNNMFDFIYIDASHLYKDVKKDLYDWFPKLKQNGLLCGHDYISMFGVIPAVNEFCIEHNFEMILFNENGGDWALKSKN